MTNIPVAPFYVPRPAEDQLWSELPVRSPILPFLTQQKMFGAGGQVPAKQWNAIYTFDDPSVWNIPSNNSDIIPISTSQRFYGAGGQTPTERWNIVYTFDDPSIWSGQPIADTTLMPMLTAGGQVKSRQWLGGLDEASIWSGSPTDAAPIPLLTVGGKPFSKQWHHDNDDPSVSWSWANRNNSGLLAAQVNPFTPVFWRFNNDDPPPWQPPQQRNIGLPYVPNIKVVYWKFNNDDSSIWSGSPIDAAAIQILTAGGQPHTKQWHYDNDDFSVWSFSAQHDLPLTSATLSPFTIRQWPFGYDDASIWTGSPIDAAPISILTVGGIIKAKQRRWDDDAAVWSFSAQYDLSLNTVVGGIARSPVFVPRPADETHWLSQPIDVPQTLPFSVVVTASSRLPVAPFYVPRPADETHWLSQPIDVPQTASLHLVPYQRGNQYFNYYDDPPARLDNLNYFSSTPSVFYLKPYKYGNQYFSYIDDPSIWSGTPIDVPQTVALDLVPYQYNNQYFSYADDPAVWFVTPLDNPQVLTLNLVLYQYNNQYFNYIDDPAIWSGTPLYAKSVRITPTGKPFVPKFYKFDIDYSEFWKQPAQRDLSMATVPGIPPYKIRQQSFAYDDLAFWYASSVASTVLPSSTVGGITKAKQWHYDNDDFSSWSFPWNNFNQVNATAAKVKPFNAVFWKFDNDDSAASWQPPQQRNIGLPYVPNIKVVYWKFNNDDPPPWQQPSQRSVTLPSTLKIEAVYWGFNNDDAAVWYQRTPQRNVALPFLPEINNRWRPDISEDQLWTLTVQTDQPLFLTYATVKRPFVNYWRLNLLEDQTWESPLTAQSNVIVPTAQVPPVIGFNQPFTYDDPAVWSGSPTDSDIIPDLTTGGQVQSHQWLFGYDDPAVWSGSPVDSDIIPDLTIGGQIQSRQWLFGYDDRASWSGSPVHSGTIQGLTAAGQVRSHQWLFGYEDPAVWSGSPVQSDTILDVIAAGQPPTLLRRYDNDDFSAWFPWANRNLIEIIALKPTISVFWKFNFDDPAVWSGSPSDSDIIPDLTTGGQTQSRQWLFSYDDPAVLPLPAKPTRAAPIPMLTVGGTIKARQWHWDNDDASVSWQHPVQFDLSLVARQIIIYLPFPSSNIEWNFAFDDSSTWQWRPRNNRFLPYKFVHSPRVATTAAELRSTDAPAKVISADTPNDVRSTDAPKNT